jgi:hypothetical protein
LDLSLALCADIDAEDPLEADSLRIGRVPAPRRTQDDSPAVRGEVGIEVVSPTGVSDVSASGSVGVHDTDVALRVL